MTKLKVGDRVEVQAASKSGPILKYGKAHHPHSGKRGLITELLGVSVFTDRGVRAIIEVDGKSGFIVVSAEFLEVIRKGERSWGI
jgi:hypothetical protein